MNIFETQFNWNGSLSYGNNPIYIVLHHAEASVCSVLDIHNWHLGNGWVGIGYHYFIKKNGTIYRGRPENAIGAHCPNYNSNSIGICVEGEYMHETMTEAQKNAVIALCKDIMARHSIQHIYRHGDVYSTNCPGTNYPFNEIVSRVYDGNYTPSQGSQETPSQPSSRNYLTIGDRGDSVRDLQSKLMNLGYNVGSYGADGVFGNATAEAVKKFQIDNGLAVDGLAGVATISRLNARASNTSNTDSNVLSLQQVMNRLGFRDSNGCKLSEDGIIGENTRYATRNFQGVMGLGVDGIAGQNTWNAINQILSKPVDGVPYPHYEYATRYIQWKVGVGVDGIFGNGTASAVRTWQSNNGLSADGIVGNGTWGSMIG